MDTKKWNALPLIEEHGLCGEDGEPFWPLICDEKQIKALPKLLEALQALGAKPDCFCFCRTQEQARTGHTGECQDAVAALKAAMP